jgi:hypothetical protein
MQDKIRKDWTIQAWKKINQSNYVSCGIEKKLLSKTWQQKRNGQGFALYLYVLSRGEARVVEGTTFPTDHIASNLKPWSRVRLKVGIMVRIRVRQRVRKRVMIRVRVRVKVAYTKRTMEGKGNKTRQDKTIQDKTRQYNTRHDKHYG